MSGSVAYARMKRALLELVNLIPRGQVAETAALAEALNIPARHAAYILSRLTEDERLMTAWHRAVPAQGKFAKGKLGEPKVARQLAQLAAEGVALDSRGQIMDWPTPIWAPPDKNRHTVWADEEEP